MDSEPERTTWYVISGCIGAVQFTGTFEEAERIQVQLNQAIEESLEKLGISYFRKEQRIRRKPQGGDNGTLADTVAETETADDPQT